MKGCWNPPSIDRAMCSTMRGPFHSPACGELLFRYIEKPPFIDGNKRISFVVAGVFLLLNGSRVEAAEDDIVETMLAVANGELLEDALTNWFAARMKSP